MPTIQSAHMPAPLGGINTVDAGSAMPATDCVYQYNLIADSLGLSSRLGWKEWVTGLGGEVRTTLPFSGSHQNGSTDKLFAVTATGIWDCSASTTSPSHVVTFGTTSGSAGYGVSTVMVTPGGHFLLYCDEENGLYIYTENTSTWAAAVLGTTVLWSLTTSYSVGDRVQNGSNVYVVTVAGTSASSGGPTGTGTGIVDGTVTWNYVSAVTANAIGPSLADQRAGYTGSPAKFVAVTVWKNRVWLVEKDSTRAWYLGINSIYGTATSFDFGSKMRSGGPLVGLYNWSYDGGSGLDTLLVGVSTAGDVVIYQGTDPSTASTFGLKGAWSVGAVPAGRRIATDYGGDILILSSLGVMPLSKLIIGNPVVDRTQYATAKVSNLFGRLASERKLLPGWALHIHPTDNALIITVPTQTGQPTEQLVMSFATRGWGKYRDLPIFSAGVWNGALYFGTTDGRVCVNDGGVDGVLLSNPDSYTPIAWSVLSAFNALGSAKQKRLHMLRPTILAATNSPVVKVSPRFNFDTSEPSPIAGTGRVANGTWDNALWDSAVWAGDQTPSAPMIGAAGMGRELAVLVQGVSTSRTTFVGVDVFFDVGGDL
jgi:hypothetical protein